MPATNVRVNMLGDSSSLVRAGRTAVRTLTNVGKSAARITGQITRIGAVAGIAATAGLLKLGKDSTESLDKLGKAAANLGTTTREVRELQLAGELAGIGGEKLTKAYQQMIRVLGDARRGSGSAADAFAELGLDIATLEDRSPTAALTEIAAAVNKLQDPTRKASALALIFGREWRSLNALFADAEGTLGRSSNLYARLGGDLAVAARSAETFKDNFTLVGEIFSTLRDHLTGDLLQQINNVVAAVGEVTLTWIDSRGGVQALARSISTDLVGAFRDLIQFAQNVNAVLTPIIDFMQFLGRSGTFFAELYGGVAAAGASIARGEFSGARRIASDLGSHLATLPDVFTGGAEGEQSPSQELGRQTTLLEQILAAIEDESGAAFQ